MSVSSVKNLNGESFSAVQDAELTDIVSNNSASWNEASAIANKLDASSTENSNIQYNDNKLYVKAVSSYDVAVLGTGHMKGNIVYDEPFKLQIPHYFSATWAAGGPNYTFAYSAYNENDVLLFTAAFNNINHYYALSTANMTYVGPGGNAYYSPIKYFSLSCSNTSFENSSVSACKIVPATGYSSSDEFALAKNVIRTDGKSEYDVYVKNGSLNIESPHNAIAEISNNAIYFSDNMRQNVASINSSFIGLGYSSDTNNYKFFVDASNYSSDRTIRLDNVISANSTSLNTDYMSADIYNGLTFSSQNTDFGSAQLTTAYGNQIVNTISPKFEARNSAGAGFSIEASGAKGYDHNGNITWDTTKSPPSQQLIAGSDSTKPSILLSNYTPAGNTASFSYSPLFSADGNGYTIGIVTSDYGPRIQSDMQGITALNGRFKSYVPNGPSAQMYYSDGFYHTYGANQPSATLKGDSLQLHYGSAHLLAEYNDVKVSTYTAWNDPNKKTWSLTGSVQKHEIEGDTATSAITSIAGSAVGTYNETVLFDGVISSNETAMLSEPASAFERIKVYGYLDSDLANQYYPWYTECTTTSGYIRAGAWTNDPFCMDCFCFIINPSGGFINATGRECIFGQTAWNVINNWATTKVIGINRKPVVVEEQTEE